MVEGRQCFRGDDGVPRGFLTVWGSQTSVSLGAALVRQVLPAVSVEVVVLGTPLPAESTLPMFVTAPVVEAPSVVVKYVLWLSTLPLRPSLPTERRLLRLNSLLQRLTYEINVSAMYVAIQAVPSHFASRRTTAIVMELRVAPGSSRLTQVFPRAHDADPVRDVQHARHARCDPGCVVSVCFETHDGHHGEQRAQGYARETSRLVHESSFELQGLP